MNKPTKLFLAVSMAVSSLTGCGSSSSTESATQVLATKTGYFIDAEVRGMEYLTSSEMTGKTNSLGQFSYKEGDRVTFHIGQLELGSAKPDATGLITPKGLSLNAAPADQDKAKEIELLLLRLLQSLDVDNNPENGITINPRLIDVLANAGTTTVSESSETALLNYNNDLNAEIDEDNDGQMDVSNEKAKAHADNSIRDWNNGVRPDKHNDNGQDSHDNQDNADNADNQNGNGASENGSGNQGNQLGNTQNDDTDNEDSAVTDQSNDTDTDTDSVSSVEDDQNDADESLVDDAGDDESPSESNQNDDADSDDADSDDADSDDAESDDAESDDAESDDAESDNSSENNQNDDMDNEITENSQTNDSDTEDATDNPVNNTDSSLSALTNDQKYSLAYMWNEERLAKDIYLALNAIYPAKQFESIATNAEQKHIDAVEGLVAKYDININNLVDYTIEYSEAELRAMPPGTYGIESVQKLYDDLYAKGVQSKVDALQVACMVEVVDVDDLDSFIEVAEKVNATDLVTVFTNLRAGSYNHYWAFDSALKAEGISEGCASLGEEYAKTEAEYPRGQGGSGQGDQGSNGGGQGDQGSNGGGQGSGNQGGNGGGRGK